MLDILSLLSRILGLLVGRRAVLEVENKASSQCVVSVDSVSMIIPPNSVRSTTLPIGRVTVTVHDQDKCILIAGSCQKSITLNIERPTTIRLTVVQSTYMPPAPPKPPQPAPPAPPPEQPPPPPTPPPYRPPPQPPGGPPPPEVVRETSTPQPQPAPTPTPTPTPAPTPPGTPSGEVWYLVSDAESTFFWCTVTPPGELPSERYKYWYTFSTREQCENSARYYQRQSVVLCEKYFKDESPWTGLPADCYLDEDAPACNYTCIDTSGWVYRKSVPPPRRR